MFYQVTLFRAFRILTDEQLDNMGYEEFIDATIMLKQVLKIIHAPYINKEKVTVENG